MVKVPQKVTPTFASNIELPNENPDIGKSGYQSPIPPGVAGVWHSHKKQGVNSQNANIPIPGATFAMIVPNEPGGAFLLLRTDIRDASGMATSTAVLSMTENEAMKFLNDNFIQTRFQG